MVKVEEKKLSFQKTVLALQGEPFTIIHLSYCISTDDYITPYHHSPFKAMKVCGRQRVAIFIHCVVHSWTDPRALNRGN